MAERKTKAKESAKGESAKNESSKGVRILVGSVDYRSAFQVAERIDRKYVLPADVLEADHDHIGNVAPGVVITVTEARAKALCDEGLKSNVPERGLPARRYRLCTRLSDKEGVERTLNLLKEEDAKGYRRALHHLGGRHTT